MSDWITLIDGIDDNDLHDDNDGDDNGGVEARCRDD
jgi:hypothetical protein